MNQEGVSEQDNLLRTMQANPDCSIAQWAESLSKPTQPWSKSKVYRLLQVLLQAKLVERTRGGEYVITVKGGKEIGGDF